MDLSTDYLGLTLIGPLVASPSPMTRDLDAIRYLADAGAAAVVLESLFEEQSGERALEVDRWLTTGAADGVPADATSYFADPYEALRPDAYMELIRRAKAAVTIPIIGSLNGVSPGKWLDRASEMETAGADALELNFYYLPADPAITADSIEQLVVDLLREIKQRVRIPVAVKLLPYFTNLVHLAHRLDEAGADGLVLFNRFYEPDLDIDAQRFVPHPMLTSVRTPAALLPPLHWIALLRGRIDADLAGSGGVHGAHDVVKLVMAGANVAMLASELLRNGIDRLRVITAELSSWLDEHEYESLADLRGRMSLKSLAYPAAFERAQYLHVAGAARFAPQWYAPASGYRGHIAAPGSSSPSRAFRPPDLPTRPPLNYDRR